MNTIASRLLEQYLEPYNPEQSIHDYLALTFQKNNQQATWQHCLKVAEQAVYLAQRYGADQNTAQYAGYLHDLSTLFTDDEKSILAEQLGIDILAEERQVPYVLHQKLSSWLAAEWFGLDDPDLLSAIACHTTLRAELGTMDKILFVADKCSWASADAAPFIQQMELAAADSLDQAIIVYLDYIWGQREQMVLHPWLKAAKAIFDVKQTQQYLSTLPALSNDIYWQPVTARFQAITQLALIDESLISNVSIVPMVGDQVVIMQLEDGRWELPGGTLEEGEHYLKALEREVMEEIGGTLVDYHIFGYFQCISSAEVPYRPYIPHPSFIRLTGYGQVQLDHQPLNPPDGEQVAVVEVVSIEEAVKRFEQTGRQDLADFYRMGYYIRLRSQ